MDGFDVDNVLGSIKRAYSLSSITLAYEATQGKPIISDEVEILQLKMKIASKSMNYQTYTYI